jgi:hypothetical protein
MLHHTSTRDLECEGRQDIRHSHVADEPNDNPIVVDMSQPQLLEITPYPLQRRNPLQKDEPVHRFCSALLQSRILVLRTIGWCFNSGKMAPDAEKLTDDHYFRAAIESDPVDPKTHGLYFTNRRSFLFAPKPHLPPSARKM